MFRSRSRTRSGSSSNSSLPIENLIASHRDLRWKGHNSAPTPSTIVNDESWASLRQGHHSAPAPIFTDPNLACFNFETTKADPQKAAAEHLFYNSSLSIPLTDATWENFQPHRISPPAVAMKRACQFQLSPRLDHPTVIVILGYNIFQVRECISQDVAELKVGGYQQGLVDQIQQGSGKLKQGDDVDPGSRGAFPGYSTDMSSHVAEQDNPRRLLWKNVLTGPCLKLKVGIVLGLVVVVALIIGLLSLCLVHPASPPSNVREPCNVDEISRQCMIEGQIIDFPVCAHDRYNEVKAAFNQTLKTDMKMDKDSCDSANLVLICVAARVTGTESTR